MAGALCRKCGSVLSPALRKAGDEFHVGCGPTTAFTGFAEPTLMLEGQASDEFALRLRDDLTEVIRWADGSSDRSQQRKLGASEVSQCMRRLGYRISNTPAVTERGDPWPAIVGTGIHMWLEQAFGRRSKATKDGRWATEMTVNPSDNVTGHTDLYDTETFTVIDWKSKGTEEMREIRKGYVPEDAVQQVQLYGLGHIRAGRRVDRVALAFVPRGGWLKGMFVWSAPFDQAAAEAALERVARAEAGIRYYNVVDVPGNWEKFPVAPGEGCGWCPWYRPELETASDQGCPGK